MTRSETGSAAISQQGEKDPEERVAVWAITPNGAILSDRICRSLSGSCRLLFASLLPKTGEEGMPEGIENGSSRTFGRLSEAVAEEFSRFSGHVFIMATGIVVRMIANHLEDKTVDPAVVVVDDQGLHSISLLSGHLGGANALAEEVADILGATAVITTATDVNKVPAIDLLAQAAGLVIENSGAIKHVNKAFLTGQRIRFHDPLRQVVPSVPAKYVHTAGDFLAGVPGAGDDNLPPTEGIIPSVYVDDRKVVLPEETLVLRPKSLFAGMGCNRGTDAAEMKALLLSVFEENGLSLSSLAGLASVDIKHDEAGLLELAGELSLEIEFFSRDALSGVSNIQTPSKMVEKHIGVKSVCEAAAILAAEKGTLVVPKAKTKNVTVAIARAPFTSSA